ncbi:hypothetical protein GCM10018987_28320 [Streptomyces cremeus]
MANRPAMCRWLSESRETAHRGCSASRSSIREPSRRLTITSGGSSDTDMKAVAVIPTSSPRGPPSSSWAVTSVTPAVRRDIAARNSSSLTPSGWGIAVGRGEGRAVRGPGGVVSVVCST